MINEEILDKCFKNELLSSDKDLLGFIPLNTFFTNYKTEYKISQLNVE